MVYIPRVLVCGSVEEFRKKIGDRPAEVVGQVIFQMIGDDVKLFFYGQSLTDEDIKKLLDGTADYLVFVDNFELHYYRKKFSLNFCVISVEFFVRNFHDGFFSYNAFNLLRGLLNTRKDSVLVLDFDRYFIKSNYRTAGVGFKFDIDCIAENFYPIMENAYRKIYRSFDECKFHHFDALLLTAERTPEEFIDVVIDTNDLAEEIWTFIRKNSPLENWMRINHTIFEDVKFSTLENGSWHIIKKFMPPVDLCVYVVTHKDAKFPTLPEGYKFIHAGHALAKNDFGYLGDDTGDNISQLNPFLDEVTALYWIWKNTNHTHTGFCHYRRFFAGNPNQKSFDVNSILSAEEILKILGEYDIIVKYEGLTDRTQREMIALSTGQPDLVRIAEEILRRHISINQPDYLDAFDDVINGYALFSCGMHITRRNIFNAYCEWLFSFIVDAVKEARDKIDINGKSLGEMEHGYSRVMGHFAERLLTVWLMKNHLRIKTLPMMYREDV